MTNMSHCPLRNGDCLPHCVFAVEQPNGAIGCAVREALIAIVVLRADVADIVQFAGEILPHDIRGAKK